MEANFEYPVSTLKVDFGCTNYCLTDVKNVLQQLKGVKYVFIDDPKDGKVKVLGNVNPMMLIEYLQEKGKKAQLLSYDNVPMQRARHVQRSKKKNGLKIPFGFEGSHPPMPTYQPFSGYHYPPPMRYQHAAYARSSMYGRPMPRYGYYGHGSSLSFPMYNPMVRYTSYEDNYR